MPARIWQGGCDPMRYAVALAAMLLAGTAMAQVPCFNGHPCELVPRDLPDANIDGRVGAAPSQSHPMTEDECHAQRGEWVPHTRIGNFAACAFGTNIEQLDRIEVLLRAICQRQAMGHSTAAYATECTEEPKQ